MIFKIADTNSVMETIDWGFRKDGDKNLLRINNMKMVIEEDLTSADLTSPISITPISRDWYVCRD